MKITSTIITVMLSFFSSYAQPNTTTGRPGYYQGRLSISMITNYPVRVLVDGNSFNASGDDAMIFRDVKAGYHLVKVYRLNKYKNNNGWKHDRNLQPIYEGNVYVKPGFHVDVVINRFGKAFTDERQMFAGYDDEIDAGYGWGSHENNLQPMNSRSFEQFKQVIRNERFDNTRLIVAKQTIASNYFSAAQVKEIVQLFSFETSKLDIAKYIYKYTIDKNNYFLVNDAFDYSSSKEELARYIQAYR